MKAILGSVERDVADAFAYIPYGLAAAVVFLLIMILYNRKKYGRVSFIIKSSLLIIYVVVVGHLTLFSRESGIVDRVDLTFFSLLEESSDYAIQLIENVLLFLPAGILCPWMWKQMRNWKRSFLLGFAGSLLIETLQMLTGRGLFQLDDLITNAAGMMAGYGIYQIGGFGKQLELKKFKLFFLCIMHKEEGEENDKPRVVQSKQKEIM